MNTAQSLITKFYVGATVVRSPDSYKAPHANNSQRPTPHRPRKFWDAQQKINWPRRTI